MSSILATILKCLFYIIAVSLFLGCGNRYNWQITYKDKKDHVYGTYIIKQYLDKTSSVDKSDIKRKLSKYFEEGNDRKGSYMFVGDAMLVDESDAEALSKFVSEGNQAIISTKIFPNTISSKIFAPCREKDKTEKATIEYDDYYSDDDSFSEEDTYIEEDEEWIDDLEEAVVNLDSFTYVKQGRWRNNDFEHLDYSTIGTKETFLNLPFDSLINSQTDSVYKTVKNGKPFYRNWHYLHDSLACIANNKINVLGYLNDTLINFFEIPHGEGSFLIHTNPLVFTNINMLNDQTSEYILAITNKGSIDAWHWDEYSRTSEGMGKSRNRSRSLISNKGPLTYILKQDALKWAWYSLLSMGFLFLVFRAKRKQRVVPVLEGNENTSLSFINTIGSLYFNKNDHKQLCKDQMQLWLEDVRHHYRINTSKLDDDFIAKLSLKTKKPKEDISALLEYYKNIDSSTFVSENTMVLFYQKLNQFSIQTKH